jgi:tetratricopeptide (TPR) repeat protein
VADLEVRLGQLHEAVANYRAALAVLEPIDAGSPERTKYTVGTIYNSMGGALTQTGPLPAALDPYRSAEKVRAGLVEQYPSDLNHQRRLMITNMNIAKVLGGTQHASLGDPATAAVYLTKARETAERLANLDSSNTQAKDDLAGLYQDIGEVQSRLHPAAAVDWFLRSVAITRELLDISPQSVDYRWWLGTREWLLAETLGRINRLPGALGHALASRDVLINLVRSQPPRKDLSRELMISYCVLSDLQHQARDDAGTSLSQQAAKGLMGAVAEGEPDLYSEYYLAKCYEVFSRTDSAHSAEWLQKSEQQWQGLTAAGVHR